MFKKKTTIIALATLLTLAGSLYVVNHEYGAPVNAENVSQLPTGEYVVTYTAGDAQQDTYGWYLPSAFGYKIYFAVTENVTFGTAEDGYLYEIGNGGYVFWDNTQAPKDGAGSINANGFRNLRALSATWDTTDGHSGVVLNAYGGDFAGGEIRTNGGTITDAVVGCTKTFFNAAYAAAATNLKIISLTVTYTC